MPHVTDSVLLVLAVRSCRAFLTLSRAALIMLTTYAAEQDHVVLSNKREEPHAGSVSVSKATADVFRGSDLSAI